MGSTHPCGQLVQKEDYHLINPSVLQSFYDRYYHSGNCSIYLAGKVSEDAIRRIETLFGSEPFGKDFRKPEKLSYVPVTSPEKTYFLLSVPMQCKALFAWECFLWIDAILTI